MGLLSPCRPRQPKLDQMSGGCRQRGTTSVDPAVLRHCEDLKSKNHQCHCCCYVYSSSSYYHYYYYCLHSSSYCYNYYPPQESAPRCTPWTASARPRSSVPASPATKILGCGAEHCASSVNPRASRLQLPDKVDYWVASSVTKVVGVGE